MMWVQSAAEVSAVPLGVFCDTQDARVRRQVAEPIIDEEEDRETHLLLEVKR
jgi:hypothetical protein